MASKRVKKKQQKRAMQVDPLQIQRENLQIQKLLASSLHPEFLAKKHPEIKQSIKKLQKQINQLSIPLIEAAKERYYRDHERIQTIKDRLSNGEINQAIRFLYEKGIVKTSYQYYEDFVEQNQNNWSIDEIREKLEEHERSREEAFNAAIDIIKDGEQYVPVKKKKNTGFLIDFL